MSKTPEIKMTVQKPMVRTCTFVHGSDFRRLRLPLPWIVYFSYMGRNLMLHGGFCDEEPTLNSTIYYPPLPNTYGEWKLCVQHCMDKNLQDNIQYFWSAPFDARVFEWEGSMWLNKVLGTAAEISPLEVSTFGFEDSLNLFEKWAAIGWQGLMEKILDFNCLAEKNQKYPNFKLDELKTNIQLAADLYYRRQRVFG